MANSYTKRLLLVVALPAIVMALSSATDARDEKTNINLAVASNFYGFPPSNSAITDIITAFQAANPNYTVTVVDNGATGTLAANIINGNKKRVDLFLAADTATPMDLLVNHTKLVEPYASNPSKKLYIFDYAQGILVLLSNTPGVDLSCETGTCGYDPAVYSKVAIADPSLAPYGVAAQTVLTGRYGLVPPLSRNSLVH